MSYFGVDLSEHNGTVDFAKLKKKVDFVILRIGWVGNKNNHTIDKRFKSYFADCKKHGIKVGGYVYMYSNSTEHAKQGAEWTLKQIKGLKFDMPIYCDMEDNSIAPLGKTKLSNIVIAFNTVLQKGGYRVGLYANLNWFNNYLTKSVAQKYHTWIAHYTSGADKYKGTYEMWQNSSTGKVDGVSGNVDTNYLYKNIFATATNTKPASKPAAPTTNKKYSNGAESFNSDYRYGKQYTVKANGGLRLRKSPPNGTILTVMPNNAKVMWYGFYTKIGNVIWRYVQYKANGKTYEGFCSSNYLK